MQGFHFYAEMPETWKSKSGCKSHRPFTRKNIPELLKDGVPILCCAVDADRSNAWNDSGMIMREAIGAVYFHENSACATTAVSREFLSKRCVRVSEALARQCHPALFDRLTV